MERDKLGDMETDREMKKRQSEIWRQTERGMETDGGR